MILFLFALSVFSQPDQKKSDSWEDMSDASESSSWEDLGRPVIPRLDLRNIALQRIARQAYIDRMREIFAGWRQETHRRAIQTSQPPPPPPIPQLPEENFMRLRPHHIIIGSVVMGLLWNFKRR